MNSVIIQLQEWHKSPLDCMILALHHLQSYYMTEIVHGQHCLGKYHLHTQYKNLSNTQPLPLANVYSPEEIVEQIKGNLQEATPESSTPQPQNLPQQLSQQECARSVIAEKICFEPTLHTFTISGSEEHPHVVRLFPKESRSCPSTTQCYHILAAKSVLGQRVTARKGKLTLPNSERMHALDVRKNQVASVLGQETVRSSLHQMLYM